MGEVKNILWIMCDQLRFDYLSCAGHPFLKTPNIDSLAGRGVRFSRAYVQSTICGPSRMSFYTGRYVRSHGSTWNGIPLRVGEPTLGDHLREIGVANVLVGKTHMAADTEGLKRLGIPADSVIGALQSECGFEVFERDDGLHPDGDYAPKPRYDDYLRAQGFESDNPWEHWANSAESDDGDILNGWLLDHANKPARVAEEHSETPYMTRRAIDFIEQADPERPWCLHLSYIKPHWPYIVPAPYHDMYGADDVIPPVRSDGERSNGAHPIYQSFMGERVSKAFSRDDVRQKVIPAYMGLIKQIDDQVGVLMRYLDDKGLSDSTMVVFTSDHGDYLGDHWLGEKELFHEQSVKVPLIIVDPSSRGEATRGSVCDALVESIDLAPTFVEVLGGTPKPHVLEGRSLLPLIAGDAPSDWREIVFSEYDYAMRRARTDHVVPTADCRLTMVMSRRWKYMHAEGFRPMLFDLEADPDEVNDLGDHPDYADQRAAMHEAMFTWARRHHTRITMSDEMIEKRYGGEVKRGIIIGYTDEDEVERVRRGKERP